MATFSSSAPVPRAVQSERSCTIQPRRLRGDRRPLKSATQCPPPCWPTSSPAPRSDNWDRGRLRRSCTSRRREGRRSAQWLPSWSCGHFVSSYRVVSTDCLSLARPRKRRPDQSCELVADEFVALAARASSPTRSTISTKPGDTRSSLCYTVETPPRTRSGGAPKHQGK